MASPSERRSSSAGTSTSGTGVAAQAWGVAGLLQRVHSGRVADSSAPLERTALRRGRYREHVNLSVQAAAAFNISSVVSLGSYGVRGDSPWRELYYLSTALCLSYTLACLWSLREKPGKQFKAFVLQEGFVYSCMLEMFTWTWISILFTLIFVAVTWGSLLFHFSGSELPGSRHFLWALAYLVNLPTLLRLDPLTSTATFKSAAIKKGYPGTAFTHVGFIYRFFLSACSCPLFLLAWLLVSAPVGLFLKVEYDMYILYAQGAVLTLHLLLVLLPRYANTVKSREVLEEQYNKAVNSNAASVSGLASKWRRIRYVVSGFSTATKGSQVAPDARPAAAPVTGVGTTPRGSRPSSKLSCVEETGHSDASIDGCEQQRTQLPGLTSSATGDAWEYAIDIKGIDADYTLPSNFSCRSEASVAMVAPEDDSATTHPVMPMPGVSSALPSFEASTPEVRVMPLEPPRSGTGTSSNLPTVASATSEATSSKVLHRSRLGDSAKMEQTTLAPYVAPKTVGTRLFSSRALMNAGGVSSTSTASGVGLLKGKVDSFVKSRLGRSSASGRTLPTLESGYSSSQSLTGRVASQNALAGQLAARRSSARLSQMSGTGTAEQETGAEGRSFRDLMFPESSSRSEHVFALSLGERPRMKNEAARFGERACDELTDNVVESVEILGYGNSIKDVLISKRGADVAAEYASSQNQYLWHAMRASGVVPLQTILASIWGLPYGAYMLFVNVLAAVHHFKDNWRWWAATKTEKFLVTTGFLMVSAIKCPTVESPITTSTPALVMAALAMAWVLALNMAVLLGQYGRANEAMVLAEVRKGGNIGSGLVFSTASILNALTFDEPVAQGYIATEWQLVHTAVISCRWDAGAAWDLEVREGRGRCRTCRVMFPRVQLYRAALAARARGCRYMWVDSMSVPQLSPSDHPDVAEAKTAAIRRLIPTMTAVYASAQLVLVLETACGQEDGPDAYHKRTWTLQECVINQCTELIHLDGRHTVLGDAASRRALSGLTDDGLADGMDDLASYSWVLEGEERVAAARTTAAQREAFSAFADSRTAWRAADKAVALGQIFFRVLFEHVDVATEFMMEIATLLAKESKQSVILIDNAGWDDNAMTGSACKTRYLMGKPSVMESGPPAMWHIRRVRIPDANANSATSATVAGPSYYHDWTDSASSIVSNDVVHSYRGMTTSAMLFDNIMEEDEEENDTPWWLCEIRLQDQRVPVAVMPGQLYVGGHVGHLRKLRTCTPKEREVIRCATDVELTKVLWM